jgi:hypothetical protein
MVCRANFTYVTNLGGEQSIALFMGSQQSKRKMAFRRHRKLIAFPKIQITISPPKQNDDDN